MLFVLVFRHSFEYNIVITSLGEEGGRQCTSRAFVLYVLVFVIFLFLLMSAVAAVCDCGTPWTFLLIFMLSANENCKLGYLPWIPTRFWCICQGKLSVSSTACASVRVNENSKLHTAC